MQKEAPSLVLTNIATANYRSCFLSLDPNAKKPLSESVIGITADYVYGKEIDQIISKIDKNKLVKLNGQDAIDRLFKMNKSKRIDYFVEEELVASFNANKLGEKVFPFKCGKKNPFYIAFHPEYKMKSDLIKLLDKEITNNRKLYKKILKENSLKR